MTTRIYIPNIGRWTDKRWSGVVERYWDASEHEWNQHEFRFKVGGETVFARTDSDDFPCEDIRDKHSFATRAIWYQDFHENSILLL